MTSIKEKLVETAKVGALNTKQNLKNKSENSVLYRHISDKHTDANTPSLEMSTVKTYNIALDRQITGCCTATLNTKFKT